MKDVFAFFDVHWFLAFIAITGVIHLLTWPFRLINRFIRHCNIRAQGWPPAHLDGDGDFRKEDAA